jgi:beta-lactamase regulating signal transducer with metallopeptidase domain
MAAWMVYSVLVASFAALATATIDRLFAIWGLPRRYLWVSAMILAALAPFVAATTNAPSRLTPPPLEQTSARTESVARASDTPVPLQLSLAGRAMRVLRRADGPAQTLWMASSAIALVVFLGAFIVLRMRRASWKAATVDGHTAWIAPDVGPAVVGFMQPRIVLPEWALQLGETDRGFVLRHESEHIRAGDPRLLLVAGLLLVAMPWNPALWWMTRRMRLAMEIDCDARVLRGTKAIREYGMLLLAVHERRGRTLPLVAALTEQRALLERRIIAMTASRPSYPRLVSAALGLVACAAAVAVAQTPVPRAADGRAAAGSATARNELGPQTLDLIQRLLADRYPTVMQGASPINRITFVLDKDGSYVTSAAWTDTAMARRSMATTTARVAGGPTAQSGETRRTFESVRMIIGAGVRHPGRNVPAAATRDGAGAGGQSQSGGTGDFGAYGFPNITGDAVLNTQSAMSLAPTPLSVLVIRLKK